MNIAVLMGIIVELLKSSKTAQELAKKFEISTRTVYRHIETLCQSGVPIVSILGKNGGFFVAENFEIKHLFFTTTEIDEMLSLAKSPTLKQKLQLLKSGELKKNTTPSSASIAK